MMEDKKTLGILVIAIAALAGGIIFLTPRPNMTPSAPAGNVPQVKTTATAPATSTTVNHVQSTVIPHGIQTYGVGEAKGVEPEIRQISVDAPDTPQGGVQKFFAVVASDAAIKTVIVKTLTDNHETLTSLTFDGTKYVGSWTVNDSYGKRYFTTFTVTDVKGRTNSATLTWRDPSAVDPATGSCGQTDGTSFTLTTTCVVSSVDGINTANFTVASGGTLQLNSPAQFAWNQGYSIFLSGTGKSLIASGAAIKKGYVCYDGVSYFITPDSATCTADGGTLRNVNPTTCRFFPRPPDCL